MGVVTELGWVMEQEREREEPDTNTDCEADTITSGLGTEKQSIIKTTIPYSVKMWQALNLAKWRNNEVGEMYWCMITDYIIGEISSWQIFYD